MIFLTLLSSLVGCRHPPPAPPSEGEALPASAPECEFDSWSGGASSSSEGLERLFGLQERELRGCPASVPATRALWRYVKADRVSHKKWANIDSSETWVRYDGVREADLVGLVDEGESWAMVRGSVGELSTFWPIHAEASQSHRGVPPSWFPDAVLSPDQPAAWSHWPAVVDECRYSRGMGHFAARSGSTVFVYHWNFQHFFPTGGCGA